MLKGKTRPFTNWMNAACFSGGMDANRKEPSWMNYLLRVPNKRSVLVAAWTTDMDVGSVYFAGAKIDCQHKCMEARS